MKLTAANLSKRAKSSLSSFTSSWALQDDDSWVKPTISANRILHDNKTHKTAHYYRMLLQRPYIFDHISTFL